MPSKKEGNKSEKENPLGAKAKYVASLNTVNIRTNIMKRLTTQRIVFGIFSFTSIIIDAVFSYSVRRQNGGTKE